MKIKKFMAGAALLALAIFLSLGIYIKTDKKNELDSVRQTRFMMGTVAEINIMGTKEDLKKSDDIFADLFAELARLEELFTARETNGQLSTSNLEDKEVFLVSQKSQAISELSNGSWDITVGPLVKLWNIKPGQENKVPDPLEIEETLKLVSYKKMLLNDGRVSFRDSGMFADYGGIAKGYAADKLAHMLREKGIENAFINLGGDIYALGENILKESSWTFGVQDPLSPMGSYLATIKLSDQSLVTSGSYERFFEEDGKIYHHLFDPRTGWPAENDLISISLISETSLEGDALATAAFVLGLEKGMELIEEYSEVHGIFITKDREIWLTSGLDQKIFKLLEDDEYKVIKNVK